LFACIEIPFSVNNGSLANTEFFEHYTKYLFDIATYAASSYASETIRRRSQILGSGHDVDLSGVLVHDIRGACRSIVHSQQKDFQMLYTGDKESAVPFCGAERFLPYRRIWIPNLTTCLMLLVTHFQRSSQLREASNQALKEVLHASRVCRIHLV
jgi:hypothetical protein